jgi:hypothetical protein
MTFFFSIFANVSCLNGKGMGGWIWCKYCVYMYVNGKMIAVKTLPGMGKREIKKNSWGGKFKYDIL